MTKEKIVPDTSVLISGILTDLIEKKEIGEAEIIIPEFAVEELRAQASKGREIGFKVLEEMKKLRTLYANITMTKSGRRQTFEEIQLAKSGRIDALIIDVAREHDATIYTSDYVQYMFAEAEGVKSRYFKPYEKKSSTTLSDMMTPDTMSLHLKEGTVPVAKRGMPGKFELVRLSEERMTAEQLETIIKEIMDAARYEDDSFVEVGGYTASVVQLGNMRIAIARPPFSDGVEVTVVRPIAKLTLDEYKLSDKLKQRLSKRVDGILVAGPPGSGKSTFAASIAEFFESQGKIVKTMESPRDLQVKPEITQYAKLKGTFENTADMLLLVRPDYTVYDEVRKTSDFEIFADMRLAGIGMLGVVHATEPIDAIQRFIGRVELGMIPHIIDTIIYIKEGRVEKVYVLSLVVRTPTGMTEADLARPVVEVKSFETNALEYEIYTYGEENVIIPVTAGKGESALSKLAKKQILAEVRRFDHSAVVEIAGENKAIVRVENDVIPRIIGKGGENIKALEERLGISIEISPKVATLGKAVDFHNEETGAYIVFTVEAKPGKIVNFYVDDEYLFSATLGKNSQIKVAKDSEMGKEVLRAVIGDRLKVFV
ncbi:MAG: Flp pilus assembly complex ATPase component TadA [Candidatus Aenigmarchaeota archaeon]|nr:Flp pilus assembly complex ATPase component TadA [Candidatus Aenigmarchaeota archaeon]